MTTMIRTIAIALLACSLGVVPAVFADEWSATYSYDDSGNVWKVVRPVPSNPSFTEQFTYYDTGSLKSGTAGPARTQDYTYDRFGNILSITTDGNAATRINFGVDPLTNRLTKSPGTTATYDEAGRMTSRLGRTYHYDLMDTVTSTGAASDPDAVYLYSATDERIATVHPGATPTYEWTLRDAGGAVLRRATQTGSAWSWKEDYVYRGGQLLAAEVPSPEKTLHYHLDHLGTPRLITGNGGVKVSEHTYYPFGLEATDPAQDTDPRRFTGHERDYYTPPSTSSSDYIDYMHARYYATAWGRFLSVDPVLGDAHRPQSWNRYAYVSNSPSAYVDPKGLCEQKLGDDPCSDMTITVTARDPWRDMQESASFGAWYLNGMQLPDGMRIDRQATLQYQAAHGDEFAMMQLGQTPPGLQEQDTPYFIFAGGIIGLARGLARAAVRTEATNLAEQLTLEEAKAGAGRRIMEGRIDDLRYPEQIWAKMEHVHVNPEGVKIVIHYWKNLVTGVMEGFKFK
ncbi:MAG TPA: RHS repeat-associated core domain-containing protein [Thermoanaerobaculia bacterium]|jgi:RHS repeat-associated protein